MLVKYATLWLFTLPLSPCNICMYYLLLISGLFTLALDGRAVSTHSAFFLLFFLLFFA